MSLGLSSPTGGRLDYQDFKYLKCGTDVDQKIVNDVELYEEIHETFIALGFSEEERHGIWRIVAACLLLGEVEFDGSTYDENGKLLLFYTST